SHPAAQPAPSRRNKPQLRSRLGLIFAGRAARRAPFPLFSTIWRRMAIRGAVRVCVIFNPTARGEKAKRFRRHLDEISAQATLKQTAKAGDARRLAAEAVLEGFDTIAAAGGDGTLNEVLNGIGDAPDGFVRARLAVLP